MTKKSNAPTSRPATPIAGLRVGAGRPKVLDKRVKQVFSVEQRHIDALDAYAERRGLKGPRRGTGISTALREILDQAMEPGGSLARDPAKRA
jgi:hypothetical protein